MESPSLFFSRELLYDGEVFGSDLELQGGLVGTKFKGYSKVTMGIKKDLTSSKTDDARSSFFVLAWDFRGCRTLPFSRGQTMPNFPKNRDVLAKLSYPPKGNFPHSLSLSLHLSFLPLSSAVKYVEN